MAARHANGSIEAIADKSDDLNPWAKFQRWHAAPIAVDIPTGYEGEDVEINLQDLDDPTELCMLLENEKAERKYWVTIALAYARQGQLDYALDVLARGLQILARAAPKDRLTILSCMSWIYLLKSRQAPRVPGEGPAAAEVKTKEHWLKEATNVMNEATRINPAYPPLYLTRGVLNLLRASLATSTKTGPGAEAERLESLNQALKNFDEAVKSSDGRNLLALMGRARALYLLKRFQQALQAYQSVLGKMPDLRDPDPRIGIGCCMWQLGYHDNALIAWERSVALNPKSVAAHSLLGVYYLREAGKYPSDTKEFETNYRKAMAIHLKTAYTLDKQYPLSCSVFSTYFLATKRYDHMEPMARKAIEQTEMNALASDGWFTIARKEHALGDTQKAIDAYTRADQARGGQNAGYFPAKFGLVQLMIQGGEMHEAKFRLEKMFERHKAVEIMTLLGIIYAEEAFAALKLNPKEDRTADIKKAVRMFEGVRRHSKDEKAKIRTKPDPTVLLYLAHLYEIDNPIESAKCLAEVELLQQKAIGEDNIIDPTLENYHELIQEQMPPQLHNNIGCFYYSDGAYDSALQRFEIALNATLKLHEKQAEERRLAEEEGNAAPETSDFTDTDALVTTISFNLARTQEALGNREDAARTYEGLLSKRHPDYTDASARLAYIASQDSPHELGPAKMKSLYSKNESDREVQALFEWYQHISKSKINFELGKDSEYIHYKKTLQEYDKHDVYALVGMGNLHLSIAREMPRNTDSEKEKRSKTYQKAYEFFDKALQLDPRNAYAAQGVAVALCDDKKSYSDALQILVKVKDTIRDASVFQNLGHVYAELRQWQRSIDNYETALRKQVDARATKPKNNDSNGVNGHDAKPNGNTSVHPKDVHLLAALSRVWFMRGKADKSILSLNTSLDLMQKALSTEPESPHLRFNVAYIQFNIVQMLNALSEAERTLEDMTIAKSGLEEAIATFEDVAQAKKPPYPKAMLEQRAAMSKGTMMRQLERSLEKQSEYERANANKLEEAKKRRAEEIQQREDAAARRQAEDRVREEEVSRKRAAIIEEAEKQAEILRQEALQRELAEMTTDEETGERTKRQKKSKRGGGGRKRKDRDDDGFIEHDEDSDASGPARPRTPLTDSEGEGQERPQKKKRKLERKGGAKVASTKKEKQGKYKSAAVIVDSDESDEEEEAVATPKSGGSELGDVPTPGAGADEDATMLEPEEEAAKPRAPRQRKQLRTIADEDENDDEGEDTTRVARAGPRIVDDDDEE